MRTVQMWATGSSSGNAICQVTIPSAATLLAINVMLVLNTATDDQFAFVQLSKTATGQFSTNGALDPFFQIGIHNNFTTSGVGNPNVNGVFRLPQVSCRQGEVIYMHAYASSTYTFNGILYYT